MTTDRELMRQALEQPPCKTGAQCVGNKCQRCAVDEQPQPYCDDCGGTDPECPLAQPQPATESDMQVYRSIAANYHASKQQALERMADNARELGLGYEPQQEAQTTHSADCYKWHHQCAIAEVERGRERQQEEPVAADVKQQALTALNLMQTVLPMDDGRSPRDVLRAYIQLTSAPRREWPQQDAWRDAVDHALVSLGSTAGSYPTPMAAINALIDWHVSVAIDPSVNGGFKLVPEQPRQDACLHPWCDCPDGCVRAGDRPPAGGPHIAALTQTGAVTAKNELNQIVERRIDGSETVLKQLPEGLRVEPGTVLKRRGVGGHG